MSILAAKNLDDAILNSLVNGILGESKSAAVSSPVDLSEFCEKLAVDVGVSLAAIVPSIGAFISGIQPSRLSEFAVSQYPSMFVLAKKEEGQDVILFRFNADSVDWWVSSSLGGTPSRKPGDMQAISPIEVRIGRAAIDLVLGALVRVLAGFGADFALHDCRTVAGVEDLPKLSDDPGGYSVSIGLVPDTEILNISFFVSESLAVDWSQKSSKENLGDSVAQGSSSDNSWAEDFENQFSIVSVSIEAVLTAELIAIEELLSWTPGRVIELEATTECLLRFLSNDVSLFTGRLGRVDDQLCVQVANFIESPAVLDGMAAWN